MVKSVSVNQSNARTARSVGVIVARCGIQLIKKSSGHCDQKKNCAKIYCARALVQQVKNKADAKMNVCQRPDYLEAIYHNKTRNRYPQPSCNPGYNIPSEVFCSLPPTFVAQPFLTETADGSLALRDDANEEHGRSNNNSNGSGDSNKRPFRFAGRPFSAVVDALDQQLGRATQSSAPDGEPRQPQRPTASSLESAALDAMSAGKPPWAATSRATKALYELAGCEPCELVLSCGDGWFGDGCVGRSTAFKKRTPLAGTGGVPALQMPNMDRAAYADGTSYEPAAFYQRAPISQLDRQGSNNPFLAQFFKTTLEQEAERVRVEYGMNLPPFPKPCPPTPMGVTPRYDPPPREAERAAPIVIDRRALQISDNCGCNRSTCAGQGTCAPCFAHPQSVAGIYARKSK